MFPSIKKTLNEGSVFLENQPTLTTEQDKHKQFVDSRKCKQIKVEAHSVAILLGNGKIERYPKNRIRKIVDYSLEGSMNE